MNEPVYNKVLLNGRPFEDFLKSAIASCILIEKYQGYFVRNIFRAALAVFSSFNKDENRFLLCLSDNLHNVPELDVRKLQRMSRQALDKLREIKMNSSTE